MKFMRVLFVLLAPLFMAACNSSAPAPDLPSPDEVSALRSQGKALVFLVDRGSFDMTFGRRATGWQSELSPTLSAQGVSFDVVPAGTYGISTAVSSNRVGNQIQTLSLNPQFRGIPELGRVQINAGEVVYIGCIQFVPNVSALIDGGSPIDLRVTDCTTAVRARLTENGRPDLANQMVTRLYR